MDQSPGLSGDSVSSEERSAGKHLSGLRCVLGDSQYFSTDAQLRLLRHEVTTTGAFNFLSNYSISHDPIGKCPAMRRHHLLQKANITMASLYLPDAMGG